MFVTILLFSHMDRGDPNFVAYLARDLLYGFIGVPIWYLFQKRELKRFFQMKKACMNENNAKQKEAQM